MKGKVWMLTGVEMETRDLYPRRPRVKPGRLFLAISVTNARGSSNPQSSKRCRYPSTRNEAFASHVFRVRTFRPFRHLTPPQPWGLSHC